LVSTDHRQATITGKIKTADVADCSIHGKFAAAVEIIQPENILPVLDTDDPKGI